MVVASATTIRLFTKTTMPTIIKVIVTRQPPPPTRTPSCRRIVLIAFSSLDCRIQSTKKTLSAHSPQLARSKSPKVYMRPFVNSLSLISITRHATRLSLFGSQDQGTHWRCDDHVSIGRERTKSDQDIWRDGVRRTRHHSGENRHARTKEPICRDVGKLTQTINWHSLSHTHSASSKRGQCLCEFLLCIWKLQPNARIPDQAAHGNGPLRSLQQRESTILTERTESPPVSLQGIRRSPTQRDQVNYRFPLIDVNMSYFQEAYDKIARKRAIH